MAGARAEARAEAARAEAARAEAARAAAVLRWWHRCDADGGGTTTSSGKGSGDGSGENCGGGDGGGDDCRDDCGGGGGSSGACDPPPRKMMIAGWNTGRSNSGKRAAAIAAATTAAAAITAATTSAMVAIAVAAAVELATPPPENDDSSMEPKFACAERAEGANQRTQHKTGTDARMHLGTCRDRRTYSRPNIYLVRHHLRPSAKHARTKCVHAHASSARLRAARSFERALGVPADEGRRGTGQGRVVQVLG